MRTVDAGQIIFLFGAMLGGGLIGIWFYEWLKLRRKPENHRRY